MTLTEYRKRIVQLHAQGLNDGQIAVQLGRTATAIQRVRSRMGLPPRSRRGRRKREHGPDAEINASISNAWMAFKPDVPRTVYITHQGRVVGALARRLAGRAAEVGTYTRAVGFSHFRADVLSVLEELRGVA